MIGHTCVLCFLSWCQRWWGACRVSYLLVIRRKSVFILGCMIWGVNILKITLLPPMFVALIKLSFLFMRFFPELVRAQRVMMNVGTGQYYSDVMRYGPLWFRKPEFYGSQNIDSKGIYSVQVCGALLSNTAPCCMSHCYQTHHWWWCPAPLLSSWAA